MVLLLHPRHRRRHRRPSLDVCRHGTNFGTFWNVSRRVQRRRDVLRRDADDAGDAL